MRRVLSLLLVLAIVGLGAVLYLNVEDSNQFRLSAPVQPQIVSDNLKSSVSGTTLTSLTTVSASTLLEYPRYTGQDPEKRRWEITARSAAQEGTAASPTLILQDVSATLEIPSKAGAAQPITLVAEKGTYQQTESTLHLTGNVKVEGFSMSLEAPQISTNINTRHLVATGGVHAILDFNGTPKK